MRTGKSSAVVAGIVTAALLAGALPGAAQDREEFPQSGSGLPLDGYTRTDGTIVLSDEAFCRHLLGSLWGGDALTYAALIDKSKKQKAARGAAFEPGSDEGTLARCVDIVGAFRTSPPEDDTVAAWARRSPVVPESLAGLLREDYEARPLARPDEIGAAARTKGRGDTVTAPFEMAAQTWLAEVDASGCSEWTGALRNVRDAADVFEMTGIREYLYDVDPGHYYWKVSAPDCEWSVDLVPVDLGPEPTPLPLPTPPPDPRVPVPKLYGEAWERFEPNPEFLSVAEARAALLAVGLAAGTCTEERSGEIKDGRVWGQDPIPGTLLEVGSPVDVTAVSDCDVFEGDRIYLE